MFIKALKSVSILLAASSLAWSADVAVFPPTLTNMGQSQGDAVGAVMAQQYAAAVGKVVLGPTATRQALEGNSGDMVKTAQSLGVGQFISMSIVTLQEKVLVEATLFDRSGTYVHQARMTAISLDDMTGVCDRLALALAGRQSTTETRGLDNVTAVETREPNRIFSEKIIGLKTQTSLPYDLSKDHSFDQTIAIGFDMRLESTKFFLEFGAGMLLPATMGGDGNKDKYGGIALELGGSYYLNQNKNVSPYVGGGLSPRLNFSPGNVSLVPYVQAGLMFMRLYSTRLYAEVKVAQHVTPLTYSEWVSDDDPYDGNFVGHNVYRKYYPAEIGLALGIGW